MESLVSLDESTQCAEWKIKKHLYLCRNPYFKHIRQVEYMSEMTGYVHSIFSMSFELKMRDGQKYLLQNYEHVCKLYCSEIALVSTSVIDDHG